MSPVIEDGIPKFSENEVGMQREATLRITITSAQLLALNATPIAAIPAPGANLANILIGALIQKPAGTAYAGIAAGEDLSFKYTDASGLELGGCETTGFLDQATNQIRYVEAYRAASGVSQIAVVANAAIVIQLLVGEIITGDSNLEIEMHYRVVKTAPSG